MARGNIETHDDVLRRYVNRTPRTDRNRLRASAMRLQRTQWFERRPARASNRTSPRLASAKATLSTPTWIST